MHDAEMRISHQAPKALRAMIVSITSRCSFAPSELSHILCGILYKTQDNSNWSKIAVKDGQLLLSQQYHAVEEYKLHEALEDLSRRPQPERFIRRWPLWNAWCETLYEVRAPLVN